MEEKFTYYDIVAHLVPGTLVLGVLALIPRVFDFAIPSPKSELVTLAAAVPLAYAVGQVVQALSSIVQPVYYKCWGGMPSSVILKGESTLLKEPRLARVLGALSSYFGSPAGTNEERDALFSDAMALCNKERLGRVDSFNASYALHRALLTTGLLSAVLLFVALLVSLTGIASSVTAFQTSLIYLFVLSVLFAAVEFFRARQRGEYFAVEVLNMAYLRAIEGSSRSPNSSNAG